MREPYIPFSHTCTMGLISAAIANRSDKDVREIAAWCRYVLRLRKDRKP